MLNFFPTSLNASVKKNATTTRSHGGLGLGLAIVRNLVEMHNGRVYADSDGEGKGATFTVQLPLAQQSGLFAENVSNPHVPSLTGLRVLVVDDDADTLKLIGFILEQYQAQVITVASVSDALAALSQFKPNVLVSDIGMPEEDGYALIHKIRMLTVEQGGQIPAVALTAFASCSDRDRVLTAGFQMHVPKPVNPAELVAALGKLAQLPGYARIESLNISRQ